MTGTADSTESPHALSTRAARLLATTTKTVPQMTGISPRWLLRLLPWVTLDAASYRVNRQRSLTLGDGLVAVHGSGDSVGVVPEDLRELDALRHFEDQKILHALAGRFVPRTYTSGETVVEPGDAADALFVLAHGKVAREAPGRYGGKARLGVHAEGSHFGQEHLLAAGEWDYGLAALTDCVVLALERSAFEQVTARAPALRRHLEAFRHNGSAPAEISVAAGHIGEAELPETFVDYEEDPPEYELSVVQTVLKVHTRVSDLYNDPIDQLDQQIRLTVEAVREQQEREIVDNPVFGLRHAVAPAQRIPTRGGPPTPDDLDELLTLVWKEPAFFLAHPRAIAAFGRECTRRGVPPPVAELHGCPFLTWRGVPLVPCDKLPGSPDAPTEILLLRVGEDRQGVIGLHQPGIPDEYAPSLSVRPMSVDARAIGSYLVSAYFSAAVLVEDALGALTNVELCRYNDDG